MKTVPVNSLLILLHCSNYFLNRWQICLNKVCPVKNLIHTGSLVFLYKILLFIHLRFSTVLKVDGIRPDSRLSLCHPRVEKLRQRMFRRHYYANIWLFSRRKVTHRNIKISTSLFICCKFCFKMK